MLKVNRQQELLNEIKEQKFITVKELMERIPCSHATLQRDLSFLEEIGEITRSYGGVSYIGVIDSSIMNKEYLMYHKRTIERLAEKIAIGKAAQQLIADGDTVYITHGTTTSQIVRRLDAGKKITLVTDGVDIIYGCERNPNVNVLSMGGLINFNSMQIEHNPYIKSEIKFINIKKLIMGVGGLSETHGVTFYDYASFSLLNDIVQDVQEIIIVADYTKFGKVALANFLPLNKISKIVTDDKTSRTHINYLREQGIECIIAAVE